MIWLEATANENGQIVWSLVQSLNYSRSGQKELDLWELESKLPSWLPRKRLHKGFLSHFPRTMLQKSRQSSCTGALSIVQALFMKIEQLWTVAVQLKFWYNSWSELLFLGIILPIHNYTQWKMGSFFASQLQFAIFICSSWFKARHQVGILSITCPKLFSLSCLQGVQYRLIVIWSQVVKTISIESHYYGETSHLAHCITLPSFLLVLKTIDGFQFLFQSLTLEN